MHSCNYVLRGVQGRKNAFILEDESVRRRGWGEGIPRSGGEKKQEVLRGIMCVRLRGALRSGTTRGRLVMVVIVQSQFPRGPFQLHF